MVKNLTLVAAFDPGRTTGYAVGVYKDSKPYIAYAQEQWSQLGFWNYLKRFGEENYICEEFKFRQNRDQTGVDLYAVELIGILNLYCATTGAYLKFQDPSIQGKKAYFSDKRLKDMGLYQKGDEFHHGRSAVKHLLHWTMYGHGAEMGVNLDTAELVTMEWAKENWI